MKLALDAILVGERRRQEMGDIEALAESIDRYGLLHAIVIDGEGQLVAGHRRLRACELLRWAEVEVRSLGDLSESERREIELEENLRRKDLTEYERSRNLAQLAQTAADVLSQVVLPDSGKTNKGGRPPKHGVAERRVAERIGRPRTTIQEAQEHVETADAYPFMQRWKQYEVLEAHEAIAQLPEDERSTVATLIDQPGIPPRSAIEILRNVASKADAERAHIYSLAGSDDSRDRTRALTDAAAKPPMPDPRLALLDDVARTLRKAIRMFPGDVANTALTQALECLEPAYLAVKEARRG